MQTYWDLSEKARAALSRSQVQEFASAELMTAGVLSAGQLELVDEPEMPEPDDVVYVLNRGYHQGSVAWATQDQAGQSAAGARGELAELSYGAWEHAVKIDFVKPLENLAVQAVPVYSQARRDEMAGLIKTAAEAKAENKKRRVVHAEAEKAEKTALFGMWDDWSDCCEVDRRVGGVLATRDEYVTMLDGDDAKAREFLVKAYDQRMVEQAEAWEAEA